MTFSERHGFSQPRAVLQTEELDRATRNRLINTTIILFLTRLTPTILAESGQEFYAMLITEFFKNPVDRVTSSYTEASGALIKWAHDCKWHALLDLAEFVAQSELRPKVGASRGKRFISTCNRVFEEEKVGYRFVGGRIVPIVEKAELRALDEALKIPDTFAGVRNHLARALELYADRKAPDYRNAIKEAISAIESASKVISEKKKATLVDALNLIDNKHGVHPALRESLIKLYGYTSDKQGIRHALIDNSSVGHAEAKLMVVSCSALCNYLIEQYGLK